ncbi:MAG TPA: GNAT family N-acetyltransferase [Steroidobacteraceae bacterium]|nr:GNAT family N-acetyltransferase [Steroidobacteraceae bacterium]
MNKIRQAVLSDLAAFLAFDALASPGNSRATELVRGIESGKCWIAEVDAKPIGYAFLKGEFFGFDFIELIYVDRNFRRRGAGRALIEQLERECKTSKLFTSTNESNTAMKGLLERCGYSPSGIIHNLDNGDPEVVFMKKMRTADSK